MAECGGFDQVQIEIEGAERSTSRKKGASCSFVAPFQYCRILRIASCRDDLEERPRMPQPHQPTRAKLEPVAILLDPQGLVAEKGVAHAVVERVAKVLPMLQHEGRHGIARAREALVDPVVDLPHAAVGVEGGLLGLRVDPALTVAQLIGSHPLAQGEHKVDPLVGHRLQETRTVGFDRSIQFEPREADLRMDEDHYRAIA